MILTPGEIHKIANRLSRLKRNHRQNGIHWESVFVTIGNDGHVYLEWKEDQGGPYLHRVPCSEFILNLTDEGVKLDNELCRYCKAELSSEKVRLHLRVCDACLPEALARFRKLLSAEPLDNDSKQREEWREQTEMELQNAWRFDNDSNLW